MCNFFEVQALVLRYHYMQSSDRDNIDKSIQNPVLLGQNQYPH